MNFILAKFYRKKITKNHALKKNCASRKLGILKKFHENDIKYTIKTE